MSEGRGPRDTDASRVLASVPLFEGLPMEAVQAVVGNARVTLAGRGAAFYGQGQPARVFFVLRRGRTKLAQISRDGQEVILRIIGPGEPLGTIAAVEPDSTYPVSALAVEPSEAFAWDGVTMSALMRRFPLLAINATRVTARRLHDLQRQHRELMTERVESRIARALLRLLNHSGGWRGGVREITFPLTHQDLAQMAGTTQFTVSRTLGTWEAAGVVEKGRRRVLIRQPRALLRIADDR